MLSKLLARVLFVFAVKLQLVAIVLAAPISLLILEYLKLLTDEIVHIVGLGVSSSLSAISLLSYMRDGRLRLLFLASAFIMFTIRESLALVKASLPINVEIIEFLAKHPADHLVNLWILLLFFVAVVKK